MEKLNKIIKFIMTKEMILLSLFLSLISQLSHSVFAYVKLSIPSSNLELFFYTLTGITFALGVSLNILIQTLKGNTNKAYLYLFFEFLINLIYYKTYEVVFTEPVIAVVQVLFAFIMPYTIASYSDLIRKNEEDEIAKRKLEEKKRLEELKIKSELENESFKQENLILKDKLLNLETKLEEIEFTQPYAIETKLSQLLENVTVNGKEYSIKINKTDI